jgi:hypothetical protein
MLVILDTCVQRKGVYWLSAALISAVCYCERVGR